MVWLWLLFGLPLLLIGLKVAYIVYRLVRWLVSR